MALMMKDLLPIPVAEYVEQLESEESEALVAAFDRYGYYLYASSNHNRVIGFTATELEGMNLAQIIDQPFHHAAWVLRTISVIYAKPVPFSSRLVSKTGGLVRISGTLLHISTPEGERYFVSRSRPDIKEKG
jgi:PAS domain S-box-containing protein